MYHRKCPYRALPACQKVPIVHILLLMFPISIFLPLPKIGALRRKLAYRTVLFLLLYLTLPRLQKVVCPMTVLGSYKTALMRIHKGISLLGWS
jgi:hypothetical protein